MEKIESDEWKCEGLGKRLFLVLGPLLTLDFFLENVKAIGNRDTKDKKKNVSLIHAERV